MEVQENTQESEGTSEHLKITEETLIFEQLEENKLKNEVYQDKEMEHKVTDNTQDVEMKNIVDDENEETALNKNAPSKENTCYEKVENRVSSDHVAIKELQNEKLSQDSPNKITELNTKYEDIQHIRNDVIAHSPLDVEIKQTENVKVFKDTSNEGYVIGDRKVHKVPVDNTESEKVEPVVETVQKVKPVVETVPTNDAYAVDIKEIEKHMLLEADIVQDIKMKQIENVKVSENKPNNKTVPASLDHSEDAGIAIVNDVSLSQTEAQTEPDLYSQNKESIVLGKPDKIKPKNYDSKIFKENTEMRQIANGKTIQYSTDIEKTVIKTELGLENAVEKHQKTIEVTEYTKGISKLKQSVSAKTAKSKLSKNEKPSQSNLGHIVKSEATITSENSQISKNKQTKEINFQKVSENTNTTKESEQQEIAIENDNSSDESETEESKFLASSYDEIDDFSQEDLDQAVDDILNGIDLDELTKDAGDSELASELQKNYKKPENNSKVKKIATTQMENKLQGPTPNPYELKCHCPSLRIRNLPENLKPTVIRYKIAKIIRKRVDFWLHVIEEPVAIAGKPFKIDGCILEFKSKANLDSALEILKGQSIMGSYISVFYFPVKWKMEMIKNGGPNFECQKKILKAKALKRTGVEIPAASAAKKFKADTSMAHTSVTQTSMAQATVAQTSTAQASTAQMSTAHASVAQTSTAHASVAQTSTADTSVAPTETVTNNEATTKNFKVKSDPNNPFNIKRVIWKHFEKTVFKNKETYGLSPKFLQSMGMRLPLSPCIHVTQVNQLITPEHKNELKEIFNLAGTVTDIFFKKNNGSTVWFVYFKHPLEAVQAVSMFNNQTICGCLVNVKLASSVCMALPPGLESIGPGLGPMRFPLPYIAQQFEIRNLKRTIRFQGKVYNDTANYEDDLNSGPENRPPQSNSGSAQFVNQQVNNSNAANMSQTQTNKPTALLSEFMTQLNETSLSKDTAASLQEQLLILAQMLAQKTDPSMQNNQSQIQVQNQPTFTPNQLPSSSGIQSQYAVSSLTSPAILSYNPYQNQMNAGLEWNTNTAAPPLNPYADAQMASMFAQQQLQLNAAMQQFQMNLNAATPTAMNALTQQSMMNPQWTVQQTNLNVVSQKNNNTARIQQQTMNPAKTQQQNMNPAITRQQNLNPKKYSADPVTYKNPQQKLQNPGPTKRPAFEPGQQRRNTLNFCNLPPSVSCQALLTKMREVGDVMCCEMTSQGRALVRFKHVHQAQKCHKLFNHSKVDGQVIEVKFST